VSHEFTHHVRYPRTRNVDPVDVLRLAFEAGLDITVERGDLAAAEVVEDVDARQHPHSVQADIRH